MISNNVSAASHVDEFNFEVTESDLPAGEYEVRVVAVAIAEDSIAMSTPSLPARFRVNSSDTVPIIIIGAVGGAVGVLVLIVVGVLVGAFFLCFYSHR